MRVTGRVMSSVIVIHLFQCPFRVAVRTWRSLEEHFFLFFPLAVAFFPFFLCGAYAGLAGPGV